MSSKQSAKKLIKEEPQKTASKQKKVAEPKVEAKVEAKVVEPKVAEPKVEPKAAEPVVTPTEGNAAKPATKTVKKTKTVAKKAGVAKKTGGSKKVVVKPKKVTTKVPAKKATVKKQAPNPQEGGEEENSKTRYFKVIVDEGDAHGRFSGNKPKQAANKALTSILKTREKDGNGTSGEIKFRIVECTRGSKHKQYKYVGQRQQLKEPMRVQIGEGPSAKTIEYKFNNRVMKDKSVDQ